MSGKKLCGNRSAEKPPEWRRARSGVAVVFDLGFGCVRLDRLNAYSALACIS
jgi:hypothetical protein